MKTFLLAAPVALLMLLCTSEAGAQDSLSGSDQSGLMNAWTGTWQQK